MGFTRHANTNRRPIEESDENKSSEYRGSPPRRGRKREFHDGDLCGPCTVWTMAGCDKRLKDKHKQQPIMRHPMDKAPEFSDYLSCVKIVLQSGSCQCEACYKNSIRKTNKPRWVSIKCLAMYYTFTADPRYTHSVPRDVATTMISQDVP